MVEKDILMEGQDLVNGPGLGSVIKIQDVGQFYFPNKCKKYKAVESER